MRASSRPASLALQCFIALLVVALVRPPLAQASVPEVLTELSLAAGAPRIAVVVVSQDLRAAQQQGALEGAAETALERAARFTVLPVHDAFNPTAAAGRNDRLEESRQKMKAGRQALDELDNVKATEAFTQALEALQDTDLSRNFPALLEAWTMKAAGHATGGENGQAKKDIEAVVSLSPRAEFTPNFFPPELLKFAEAQRKFAANAKGELLVRTEPAGARVWVDGVYRGVSPVTVAGLTGVKHFIAASEGGYALGQSQAAPGEEVLSLPGAEIGPGWKKATTEIKKDPEGSTRDSAAQALGKAAKLDQVLLVLSKKSLAGDKLDLIALRLEVRDGHNAAFRTGTVNAGDPEQLATFFDGLTGKDARRDGKDPVHHFKGGGSSPIKTVAGFSLLGLGVVALASGVTFGVLASGRANDFAVTPQTRVTDSLNLKTEGQTFAAVADVSYIVGLLAAGGGAVLLLTNNGGGGADETAASGKKPEDARRRELERKAAEDRRAAEERAKEDERRRDEERAREEEKKKDAEAENRRAEEEEARRQEEEAAKKKEEEEKPPRKLTKKEQQALERKKREEERKAAEEKKRAEEEEARARRAEEKKNSKLTKKQRAEEEERKRKEEEAAKAAAEEEARAQAEAEARKKKEEEERKKREEAEKRRKAEDHDDLRNY